MIIKKKIIGIFEPVDFPDYGMDAVSAKIDTGAFTGALHCTKISEDNGSLTFSPFDHPEITITTGEYTVKSVTSSNGVTSDRYFIRTNIIIKGTTYPIELSLADRSEMKWPMLIGRKFLKKNNFLVDSKITNGIVT